MKENDNRQLELDNTNPFDNIGFEDIKSEELEQQSVPTVLQESTSNVDSSDDIVEINYDKDNILRLEKRRINIVILKIIVMLPFFGFAIFWIYFTIFVFDNSGYSITIVIAGALWGAGISLLLGSEIANFFFGKKIKKLNLDYKNEIVSSIFNSVFQNVFYQPGDGIREGIIGGTCIFPAPDNFESNDYIRAKYKNVEFEFSDVFMEEERENVVRDEKNDTTRVEKYYVTLFKGQWLIFNFNKRFKRSMQIIEKGFRQAVIGGTNFNTSMSKIEFEDSRFNKIFSVYAMNDYEAFYIMTPSMINNIMELKSKINKKILFCFTGNKLHIGISNSKDLFEINMYRKINLDRVSNEILNEIKLITNFVDLLNLDNDLFKE